MAIGSGLSAQMMMKAESTYNTGVTVDRPYEFNSETFTTRMLRNVSRGIGRGTVDRTDRRKAYSNGAEGSIEYDVMNKGFGLHFQHALGQNTVSGAGADRTHTCVLDSLALQGKFATVQIGKPDVGGTVRPFTYTGGKIQSWELKSEVDQSLKWMENWDFAGVTTGTALASPSYVATQEHYIFQEGGVTIGGSTAYVKSFSLRGDRKLDIGRRYIGGTKKEPLAGGYMDLGGKLSMEFESLTNYAAALAGTQQALVFTFALSTVIPTTSTPYSLTVTLAKVEFSEAKPVVSGPGLVMLELPYKVLDDGSNPPISLVYLTSDTAA